MKAKTKVVQVTNRSGIPFTVRLVEAGDRYGAEWCKVHEGEPVVEFYDYRHKGKPAFQPFGQLITSYHLSTMLARDPALGLCLNGSVPAWVLDGEALTAALTALQS